MMTILLTMSEAEARAHAKAAGLGPNEVLVASSGTQRGPNVVEGLRLEEDWLIVEFPGFRDGPYQRQIVETLHAGIARSGNAGPEWVAVQGKPLAP